MTTVDQKAYFRNRKLVSYDKQVLSFLHKEDKYRHEIAVHISTSYHRAENYHSNAAVTRRTDRLRWLGLITDYYKSGRHYFSLTEAGKASLLFDMYIVR